MNVDYKIKDGSVEYVTLVCSTAETLIIMDALRRLAESEEAHELNKVMAKGLYEDIRHI